MIYKPKNLLFSEVFGVSEEVLEDYGALNISMISDLPLFVDPFLLFQSDNEEYKQLHCTIIKYMVFLQQMARDSRYRFTDIKSLFRFKEIRQNYLGYCKIGNRGRGLGPKKAEQLHNNLKSPLLDFDSATITSDRHIEKLSLFDEGIGVDIISDFTTNLIFSFLLKYTERFATRHIDMKLCKRKYVRHVSFDFENRIWLDSEYVLPYANSDFVILTPQDLLSQDDTWINRSDLYRVFERIPETIDNDALRIKINEYFFAQLPRKRRRKIKKDEIRSAIRLTLQQFPVIYDYYIKFKEDTGDVALRNSSDNVLQVNTLFIDKTNQLISLLDESTDFYKLTNYKSKDESYKRIMFLKHVIENQGGWRIFHVKGAMIRRESDLQLLYRLTWFASEILNSPEAETGIGPVDFLASFGSRDQTIVEFKLASNTSLRRGLTKQVPAYMHSLQVDASYIVIMFFTGKEQRSLEKLLKELELQKSPYIILINARNDDKKSASRL